MAELLNHIFSHSQVLAKNKLVSYKAPFHIFQFEYNEGCCSTCQTTEFSPGYDEVRSKDKKCIASLSFKFVLLPISCLSRAGDRVDRGSVRSRGSADGRAQRHFVRSHDSQQDGKRQSRPQGQTSPHRLDHAQLRVTTQSGTRLVT